MVDLAPALRHLRRKETEKAPKLYPIVRIAKEILLNANRPLGLTEMHVSRHICWPWDLDVWMELNNGRTLTLYDLGRFPFFLRTRMGQESHRMKLMITMAGATVRYRRRVRAFDRVTMKSHILGWDDRFFYMEQAMWRKDGDCASHVVYRVAVAGRNGISPPAMLAARLGHHGPSPALPEWILKWSEAEALRPWPPMQD